MDINIIQKNIEDSLFDFIDKILNKEECFEKSRIKYYNEITSFVSNIITYEITLKNSELEDEINDLENRISDYNFTLDNLKSDMIDSFQDILTEIKNVDKDSMISMCNCIENIEAISKESINNIGIDYDID